MSPIGQIRFQIKTFLFFLNFRLIFDHQMAQSEIRVESLRSAHSNVPEYKRKVKNDIVTIDY